MTATTHPAITRAQAVHDQPRDLERHEQIFLTAVHRITMELAQTKGEAIQSWGDGSRAYVATVDLATRKHDKNLTAALEAFDLAVEAADEGLEVDAAVASAMAEA